MSKPFANLFTHRLQALIYPQSVIVYQVDDKIYAPKEIARDNTFNTFLDALDGSYCNYPAYGITGDSPGIDPKYPDPKAGGYKGHRQCGVYTPTRVISISYGESEQDFPKPYVERQSVNMNVACEWIPRLTPKQMQRIYEALAARSHNSYCIR